ncbi:hypothetical protein [Pseudactinotalea sp. Z1748]|uniref:hypothetical protein n=1 Tax=Pseudactinotalea sp. Z1748 TaxID=3413027 RepID=UPI003C79E0D0
MITTLMLAVSACGSADSSGPAERDSDQGSGGSSDEDTQQSNQLEVPPALANKGLEFSDVHHFFGGGWVYVDTRNTECDPGTACVNLVVAADPACSAGFFAEVEFRDEYGDRIGQVRERVMGAGPNLPQEMRVTAPAGAQPTGVEVPRAGCIT